MRYLTSAFIALFLVVAPVTFLSAQGVTNDSNTDSSKWNTNMMQFENEFIGDDALYEQMDGYMKALFDGELTDEQQQQMYQWMRSDEYQPAMMSMMMRNMMGNGWNNGWTATNMMSLSNVGSWWGLGGLITMILVWTFLLLGIVAFWRSFNRVRK